MFFFEPSGQSARPDFAARAAAVQASEDARAAQVDAARRDLAQARRSLAVTSYRVARQRAARRAESERVAAAVRAVFEDR